MSHKKSPMMVYPLLVLAYLSCNGPSGSDAVTGEWLIPKDQVLDGGPGKDGIPALTNPAFVGSSSALYLRDDDLVIGVKSGDVVRAYPHPILDWHEIINDEIGAFQFSLTYCPLTGSGISWNRRINGTATTFGVSGLLYNTNLIPYDRATNSNWSQMKLQCVNGPLIGTQIEVFPIVETTWRTWKRMYPQTLVVSSNTGYSRPYGSYPYGDYRTSNTLLFPISNRDNRLPLKERVHGVIAGGRAKVYRISQFADTVTTINDHVDGVPIVVVGSAAENFAASFERRLPDGTELSFAPVTNRLPIVMIDNEGTVWDVFGVGVSGPRAGTTLRPGRAFTAYWFAWATFFPGVEIY